MHNRNQRYIQDAHRRVNEGYLNFVDDNLYFAPQDNMFYADGNGSQMQAAPAAAVKKSMPYIITVSSASGAAVSNFNVLGYSLYYNNPGVTFDASGNLVIGSITLSSGVPNATYRDLLNQSQSSPFTAGMTYIIATTPSTQAQETFTITTFDANGTLMSIPVVPNIDPYQQQSNMTVTETEYRVDGMTYLTFSSIAANAVFTIKIFPSDNLNTARGLANMQPIRNYGNPGVIRKSQTVLPGGTSISTRIGG